MKKKSAAKSKKTKRKAAASNESRSGLEIAKGRILDALPEIVDGLIEQAKLGKIQQARLLLELGGVRQAENEARESLSEALFG